LPTESYIIFRSPECIIDDKNLTVALVEAGEEVVRITTIDSLPTQEELGE
jgi:hypothetical protein